jgi:fimbrial chaperone protein
MRRFSFFAWALLALLAATAARAADIGIMPTAVQLDRTHDRATVQVMNHGTKPVLLQAEAIAWKRQAGEDQDGPTSDLLVNPPVFTVQPGQTQIVRVGLRRNAEADREATYRMVLREVPLPAEPGETGVSGAVRVLVALRVPVYVAPVAVQRDERWVAHRDQDGNVIARLTNAGNVHARVAAIRLHDGPEAQVGRSAPMAEKAVGAVIFPGEARSFHLPARAPAPAGARMPMTLEVLTDRGPRYVPLEVASN